MEKVADWVAHSPVVAAGVRAAREFAQRRNSSPPPLPKFEKMSLSDTGAVFDNTIEEVEGRRKLEPRRERDEIVRERGGVLVPEGKGM